ncbi:MAG: M48 family metallopeptidase [Akkermansiaceae bacterium]
MDFFQAQEDARKRTKWLVLYFMLAVTGVILSVYVLMVFLGGFTGGEEAQAQAQLPWSWELLGGTAVAAGGTIFLGSLFKIMRLSGGGAVVARDLGARQVDSDTRDPDERRLLNIVEEMAIASGMVAPEVWVMDQEEGINAFAAGTDPSNAVVAVSRGCLAQLNRSELQGVVAHEFSHILNGDMKLNMRLIGWLFGILMLSMIGRILLRSMYFRGGGGRGRDKGGAGMALLVAGIGLLAIGSIGVFFGRLIQAAISRQREFLADAAAVQFTRDPSGIAGALKKIGASAHHGKIEAPKASEASHMFFANAGMFSFGFATHPPLDVRIRAIERDWDGKFPHGAPTGMPATSPARGGERVAQMHGGAAPARFAQQPVPPPLPASLYGDGAPQLAAGIARFDSLREEWRDAAHTPDGARTLVFGLLLADDPALRATELAHLTQHAGAEIAAQAAYWQGELSPLESARKIALTEIAIAPLRRLAADEYQKFKGLTRWLIASDGQIDLFEFMLQKLVERHLDSVHGQRQPTKIRHTQLRDLQSEIHLLVSTMAGLSSHPEAAYAAAMKEYRAHGPTAPAMLPPAACQLDRIGAALEKCDAATPLIKREILRLCALAATSDGGLADSEAELLRAIADAIGCQISLQASAR